MDIHPMLKDWLEDLTLSTDSMQSLSTSHDFIFFQKGKKKSSNSYGISRSPK